MTERGDAQMSNTVQNPGKRLQEVMTRNLAARDMWQHIETALADSRDLIAEVARLSAELAAARLHHANALAAIRAALGADRDGEPDPLYFLRDELEASQDTPDTPTGGNRG